MREVLITGPKGGLAHPLGCLLCRFLRPPPHPPPSKEIPRGLCISHTSGLHHAHAVHQPALLKSQRMCATAACTGCVIWPIHCGMGWAATQVQGPASMGAAKASFLSPGL
jgi:hypothetical protein